MDYAFNPVDDENERIDTVLIALPWQPYDCLSIQLGSLSAYLKEKKVEFIDKHYYKCIIDYLSQDIYHTIHRNSLGELISYSLLNKAKRTQVEAILTDFFAIDIIKFIMDSLGAFYGDIITDLKKIRPKNICFTTSHEQIIGSIYLSKLLKEHNKKAKIILGGALINDFNSKALIKQFPWIDYLVYGEGELTLSSLLNEKTKNYELINGLTYKNDDFIVSTYQRKLISNLDKLPFPNFDGYYNTKLKKSNSSEIIPKISLEASRGCQWGKCRFCNLSIQWNGRFRKKTSKRISDEIKFLVEKYETSRVLFCGNDISKNISSFIHIKKQNLGLDCFAEISPTVNFEDLKLLKDCGVNYVQVGIESLSDRLLTLYNKPASMIENIAFLKWCMELDIKAGYNLIINYPNDTSNDVKESLKNLEYFRYFNPPSLVNFSVSKGSSVFRNRKSHNIKGIKHPDLYLKVYGKEILSEIYDLICLWNVPIRKSGIATDWSEFIDKVDAWKTEFENRKFSISLTYRDSGTFLLIFLKNDQQSVKVWRLKGLTRIIYLACSYKLLSVGEVQLLSGFRSENKIEKAISFLCKEKLMYEHDGKLLSLAIKEK